MTEFLALLALHYICDHAAATRGLSPAEVSHCMANYETIKHGFIDEPLATLGTPERAAQNRAGYAGFKAWEADNAALVDELRAYAQLRLQHG